MKSKLSLIITFFCYMSILVGIPGCGSDAPEDKTIEIKEQMAEAMELENYSAAVSWAKQLEPLIESDDASSRILIARAYMKNKEYDTALKVFNNVNQINQRKYKVSTTKSIEEDIELCKRQIAKSKPSEEAKRPGNRVIPLAMGKAAQYSGKMMLLTEKKKIEYCQDEICKLLDAGESIDPKAVLPLLEVLHSHAVKSGNIETIAIMLQYHIAVNDSENAILYGLEYLNRLATAKYKYHPDMLDGIALFKQAIVSKHIMKLDAFLMNWEKVINKQYIPIISQDQGHTLFLKHLENAKVAILKEDAREALKHLADAESALSLPQDNFEIGMVYSSLGDTNRTIHWLTTYLNAVNVDQSSAQQIADACKIINQMYRLTNQLEKMEPVYLKYIEAAKFAYGTTHHIPNLIELELKKLQNELAALSTQGMIPDTNSEQTESTTEERKYVLPAAKMREEFKKINLLTRSGKKDEANETADRINDQLPDDPQAYYQLAVMYTSNDRPDSAADLLIKAANMSAQEYGPESPQNARYLIKLADVLVDLERYLEAKTHLEQLISIYQDKYGSDSEKVQEVQAKLDNFKDKLANSQLPPTKSLPQTPKTIIRNPMMMDITSNEGKTPESTVKSYLIARLKGDLDQLIRLSLPNSQLYLLLATDKVPEDQLNLAISQVTRNSNIVTCKVGQTVTFPNGERTVITSENLIDGRSLQLVYLNNSTDPLPIWVVKIAPNRWAVDSNSFIAAIRLALNNN